MRLNWQPELRDYLEAAHARNRARHMWIKITIVVLFSAVFVAASAAVGLFVPAGIGALVLVGVPLGVPLIVRNRLMGMLRREPLLREPTSVMADPQVGLVVTSPRHKVYRWRELRGMVETERVFVVLLPGKGAESMLLLAKRGLAQAEQVAQLRSMLVP